jgi:hypothetical protein
VSIIEVHAAEDTFNDVKQSLMCVSVIMERVKIQAVRGTREAHFKSIDSYLIGCAQLRSSSNTLRMLYDRCKMPITMSSRLRP